MGIGRPRNLRHVLRTKPPRRVSIKNFLYAIPSDGCLLVFNCYFESWKNAANALGYSARHCDSAFYGRQKGGANRPPYGDLYITERNI